MGYTFVMAGGGTGGHVIPGIAVARELVSRGHRPVFIGTRHGLESTLVPAAGFPLELIAIGSLKGQGTVRKLRTMAQIPASMFDTLRIFRKAAVSAVFSMGGYAAGPVLLAAMAARMPMILMEPNAVPGLTNRRMGRFARKALLSFDETARFFPKGRVEMTGLPVRDEFFSIAPKPRGELLDVLVTGGSRGARTLNQAVRGLWSLIREAQFPVRVRLQTGPAEYDDLAAEFDKAEVSGQVEPFIADMPGAFAKADLIVCRAGAGAVAELAAAGKPSILIPYPFAADDHQAKNAEAMQNAGAARLVLDAHWTARRMYNEIESLLSGPVLETMGTAARRLGRPGAAQRAAELLEECATGR